MTPCSCCYTDTLAKCETEIKLNIILPVYTDYRWVITDKFGNKYQGELNDERTIPVADLPAGLLTQYSGTMKLEIFEAGTADCGPEEFLVAGRFDCIEFEITGGTFEKNNLGCAIGETPAGAYTEYLALLTQEGESDPTAQVIINTLGVTPTLARQEEGVYTIVAAGMFDSDTVATASAGVSVVVEAPNQVYVSTGADGVLNGTQYVHIKKY